MSLFLLGFLARIVDPNSFPLSFSFLDRLRIVIFYVYPPQLFIMDTILLPGVI